MNPQIKITGCCVAVVLAAIALTTAAPAAAQALKRPQAHTFAVLPDGATGPEGLTVGPDGNLYVGTFGYNAQGEVGGNGQLYVFTPDGDLIRQVSVAGSTSHLLGLAFQPHTGRLLVPTQAPPWSTR